MRCCEAANVVTRVTTSGNITDDFGISPNTSTDLAEWAGRG
jgi:hypothetical protein